MYLCLAGSDGKFQGVGNFLMGVAINGIQDEDLPGAVRQRLHGALQIRICADIAALCIDISPGR